MLFMKKEMADCLTFWPTSYGSDDLYRLSNMSFDETYFTDNEGKEVLSLLDDLAEAKRHNSTDDVTDVDADCISLWEGEQWTTKDLNGGPTLAELNGGELTDLEQYFYEPLQIPTKRKRARNSVTGTSHRRAIGSAAPEQICKVSDIDSSLQNVQHRNVIADDRSVDFESGFQHDQERSVLVEEQQNLKGTLNTAKPVRKVHPKHALSVCSSSQPKEDIQTTSSSSASYSKNILPFRPKHSWKSDSTDLAVDFCASKRMKNNHGVAVTTHPTSVADVSATKSELIDVENAVDNTLSTDDTLPSPPWYSSSLGFDTPKQYFWLYNIQSKGPKCQPVIGQPFSTSSDPHILPHFSDPARDVGPKTSVRYSGQQKDRGSTEVDANPRRLLQIGNELQRLTTIIGAAPSSTAAAEFSLSPREKNKFASRVCRLKRKAQHEANKIKLQGLEQEHRQLMTVLTEIRSRLVQRVKGQRSAGEGSSLTSTLQTLMKTHLSEMIAEHTDEYVSCTLEQLEQKVQH